MANLRSRPPEQIGAQTYLNRIAKLIHSTDEAGNDSEGLIYKICTYSNNKIPVTAEMINRSIHFFINQLITNHFQNPHYQAHYHDLRYLLELEGEKYDQGHFKLKFQVKYANQSLLKIKAIPLIEFLNSIGIRADSVPIRSAGSPDYLWFKLELVDLDKFLFASLPLNEAISSEEKSLLISLLPNGKAAVDFSVKPSTAIVNPSPISQGPGPAGAGIFSVSAQKRMIPAEAKGAGNEDEGVSLEDAITKLESIFSRSDNAEIANAVKTLRAAVDHNLSPGAAPAVNRA